MSKLLPMMRILIVALMAFASSLWCSADVLWLDAMELGRMQQGYTAARTNASVSGAPISFGTNKFARGVGTCPRSVLWVNTRGATIFSATVGVNDSTAEPAGCVFRVFADANELFNSGALRRGGSRRLRVNVGGSTNVLLLVEDAGNGKQHDHAVWADAKFEYSANAPSTYTPRVEEARILTPKPGKAPRINGPTIYGCRPGSPFLYRIPTQGMRPITFTAEGLPPTLQLDAQSGIVKGTAPDRGMYGVTITAVNQHGKSTRGFRICSGDKLALTPPMGWNEYYAHYSRITQAIMQEAADLLISTGMADAGYNFVNVDDTWMNSQRASDPMRVGPARDANSRILANKHFPDMPGLANYIHSKGLKAGLYASPGPTTCNGYTGSWQHEALDAETFAQWGYDFLKYDWCSYGEVAHGRVPGTEGIPKFTNAPFAEVHKYPYKVMGDLLKKQPRDIVLNICEYGAADVWEWGAAVGGHSWRTAGDLGYRLGEMFEVAIRNSDHRAWSAPGAWNDPDYIQLGWFGNTKALGLPEPTEMRPNEQYAYMSLWALMASPLFYSGDLTRMDDFTMNLLCNPEVIDINQDALGQGAAAARLSQDAFLLIKDLESGAKAIGLFNNSEFESEILLPLAVCGLRETAVLRDAWRQEDIGRAKGERRFKVPARGCVLLVARS